METNMIRNARSLQAIDDAFRQVTAAEILPLRAEIQELRLKFTISETCVNGFSTSETIVNISEAAKKISLSKDTWRPNVSTGIAPAPVKIGARRIGWRQTDIDAWLCGKRDWGLFSHNSPRQPHAGNWSEYKTWLILI
jgi:predicted DNA-binding transcriptional regulator AlpA